MEQNKTNQGRNPLLWGGVLLAIAIVCAWGCFGASRAYEKAQAAAGARAAAEIVSKNAANAEAAAQIAVEAAARAIAPAAAEARQLLRSVLTGEGTFLTADNGPLGVDDLTPEVTTAPLFHIQPYRFAVVDLDQDSVPEVVLALQYNTTREDVYGYEILHVQDGQVYGMHSVYRGLEDLKEDGSSYFNRGLFDSCGYQRIRFLDGVIREDDKFLYYVYLDETRESKYYQNGQLITQAEYEAAEEAQRAKSDVTWYDFTEENILALFP